MNTTTAANQAHVTVATIRTWCRRGVITATKTAGRWIIDTASLAHRIAIGAMRARKATPVTITATITQTRTGQYAMRGDADQLAAAFTAGTPVTPTNSSYAADRLYLGRACETYGDYGRTTQTTGLAYMREDGQAVYYLDMKRLDEAPAFRQAYFAALDAEEAAQAAADARDSEYFSPRYM